MASSSTWAVDTAVALAFLGGESHLSRIYEVVLDIRTRRRDPIGQFDAWVRHALQQNSRGRGWNWFIHLGPPRSGMWGLNPKPQGPTDPGATCQQQYKNRK